MVELISPQRMFYIYVIIAMFTNLLPIQMEYLFLANHFRQDSFFWDGMSYLRVGRIIDYYHYYLRNLYKLSLVIHPLSTVKPCTSKIQF